MAIRLLIIDDHELAHAGLRMLCATRDDLEIAACYQQAKPALSWLESNDVDIVILDLELPDLAGPSALAEIINAGRCDVIILTGANTGEVMRTCIELGAKGVVSKGDPVQHTLEAIDAARRGDRFLSPMIERLLADLKAPEIMLPPRQHAILQLLADGFSNKEIAYRLGIAAPTVSFHLAELRRRFGAASNLQLVDRARASGLAVISRT
jgi:two-component system nitrate/nitrite response regulator NarL